MSSERLFKTAYTMHAQGQVSGAFQLYRQLLEKEDVNKVDLYYMYSIALYQLGQFDEALTYLEKVLGIKEDYPPALNQKGVVLQQLQQYGEARECFEKAIQKQPEYVDAHLNLAKLHMATSDTESALAALKSVLQIDPGHFPALASIGQIYQRRKAYELAREYYVKAVSIQPENVGILQQLGLISKALGMYEDAITYLKKSVSLNPEDMESQLQLSDVLIKTGQSDSAENLLQKLYARYPLHPRIINAYIEFLIKIKNAPPAVYTILSQLLAKNPANVDILNLLGLYYAANCEWMKAEEAYGKVLQSDSLRLGTWINLGNAHKRQGKVSEAVKCYQKALELDPEHPNAQWALSLGLLHLGKYLKGWHYFPARYHKGNTQYGHLYRKFYLPFYTGEEDITDKTLLLYVEQGYGDSIQFFRFLPLLAQRCKRVCFLVHEALFELFKKNCDSSNVLFLNGSVDMDSIDADYQIPIMDLARIFEIEITSVPFSEGYLKSPERLCETSSKKRISIVWKSISTSDTSSGRSVLLTQFLSLFDEAMECTVYSMQKELDDDERSLLEQNEIEELGSGFDNFMDTAKALACMDLVITVDTALAHLSAAMGKETWILISTESDWRWGLEEDQTPWYTSAKMYRQSINRKWDTVLKAIRRDLKEG